MRLLIALLLLCNLPLLAQTLTVDGHQLHFESWGSSEDYQKPTLVLLSGPIDTWHSDSVWWASVGPILAKDHRVIALDRVGQVLGIKDADVGYEHFAKDLALSFAALKITNATVVAFASSNISVQLFLAANPQQYAIKQVIMIDPDVLSAYSIARYKNDAALFKQNLPAYVKYILAGKYQARTAQKNASELAHLKDISEGIQVDWPYVEKLQNARLELHNQVNLFNEIAIYDEDLDAAAATQWPANMPLIVIDTDFETPLINQAKDETEKKSLIAWQQDARRYYQKLAALNPANVYIESPSPEHLYQFAQLNALLSLIKQAQSLKK